MVKKYALIQKGKIAKLRNVPDDDTLAITKMVAHGYIPVVEGAVPMFDYITQLASDTYEINADKVTRKWTINEQQFEEAKRMKEEEIKSKALDYIRAAFDSDSGDSQIAGTLATKKGEFMTALSTAKSNEDLRNITVKYETAKEMMGA
jgi:hypothetical protein